MNIEIMKDPILSKLSENTDIRLRERSNQRGVVTENKQPAKKEHAFNTSRNNIKP